MSGAFPSPGDEIYRNSEGEVTGWGAPEGPPPYCDICGTCHSGDCDDHVREQARRAIRPGTVLRIQYQDVDYVSQWCSARVTAIAEDGEVTLEPAGSDDLLVLEDIEDLDDLIEGCAEETVEVVRQEA